MPSTSGCRSFNAVAMRAIAGTANCSKLASVPKWHLVASRGISCLVLCTKLEIKARALGWCARPLLQRPVARGSRFAPVLTSTRWWPQVRSSIKACPKVEPTEDQKNFGLLRLPSKTCLILFTYVLLDLLVLSLCSSASLSRSINSFDASGCSFSQISPASVLAKCQPLFKNQNVRKEGHFDVWLIARAVLCSSNVQPCMHDALVFFQALRCPCNLGERSSFSASTCFDSPRSNAFAVGFESGATLFHGAVCIVDALPIHSPPSETEKAAVWHSHSKGFQSTP